MGDRLKFQHRYKNLQRQGDSSCLNGVIFRYARVNDHWDSLHYLSIRLEQGIRRADLWTEYQVSVPSRYSRTFAVFRENRTLFLTSVFLTGQL